MRRLLLLLACLALLTGGRAVAQDAPRTVVQKFYADWLRHSRDGATDPTSARFLAAHRDLFEPAFLSLIQQVMDLGRIRTQIEGYDGDPFFNTQDAVYSFRLGRESIRNGLATVPVHAMGGRQKPDPPERLVLTAQLRRSRGTWRIVDMVYPYQPASKDPTSLKQFSRQILDEYRRRHPSK